MPGLDIAKLMAPLGPLERPPSIAVAVSGGSDSLGLGLLLAEWVKAREGRLHVLTVDHGLRSEAAAECARVAEIFAAIPGCSPHVLRWRGQKPEHGLQAAARAARYALLADWCRAHGVLHLAVGHTAEDQAETVAMRQAHGSGQLGLAGMAALRPEAGVRLLRPLLAVSRPAIRDWLRSRGQDWIEDPSNELTRFERVRIRQSLAASEAEQLHERARQAGNERDRSERAAAALLAEVAQVQDSGYVAIGLEPFLATPREVRTAALRQVMLSVSGAGYAPDLEGILAAAASGGPWRMDAWRMPAPGLAGPALRVPGGGRHLGPGSGRSGLVRLMGQPVRPEGRRRAPPGRGMGDWPIGRGWPAPDRG